MKKCRKCGEICDDAAKFCSQCASPDFVPIEDAPKVEEARGLFNPFDAETYRGAAEYGEPLSQFLLAKCYMNGMGVERSPELAVMWYTKSAEQETALAQYELGKCCLWGLGVAQNKKKAFEWFEKAAEAGYEKAQAYLGYCYLFGWGVEQDDEEASSQLYAAADDHLHIAGGAPEGILGVGLCYLFGIDDDADEELAYMKIKLAAKRGCEEAFFALGKYYDVFAKYMKNDPEAAKMGLI